MAPRGVRRDEGGCEGGDRRVTARLYAVLASGAVLCTGKALLYYVLGYY
jgi:hypothetical protein